MTRDVIAIAGPTASGKSRAALDAAVEFGGAVINMDSMQVYRALPVLTAQPSAADRARAPHRLYGIVGAGERFSVAAWLDRARAAIEVDGAAGRLPILCGGTGLYLKALTEGLADIPDIDPDTRAAAGRLHDDIGGAAFRARLAERDAGTAARLADGDRQRLIRAWEVVVGTGRPLSAWQEETEPPADLRIGTILIMPPRATLYAACDARLDAMIAAGAVDEVRALIAAGAPLETSAAKALGVPDIAACLRGETGLDDARAAAKRATRRYAKRQATWFRHQLAPDHVINAQYSESFQAEIFTFIRRFLLTGGS